MTTGLHPRDRQMAAWLFVCCVLVFGMVVLGGMTRLTGSGLSMVTWEPVKGALPPLSEEAWEEMFAQYQQTPEYRKVNTHMDVHDFKGIFWLEYIHRLLGRLIGIVFLLPFLYFWKKGRIQPGMTPKLLTMFLLGGLQGLVGWLMVASGLVNDPHVSQYRLAIHLCMAFIIFAYMFWVGLSLWFGEVGSSQGSGSASLARFAWAMLALAMVTVFSGGLVAGLKAGLTYNTFPLMDGRLIPAGFLDLSPLWRNFFENIPTVQWDHRFLAVSTFLGVLALWMKGRREALSPLSRGILHLLLIVALVQVGLGIATLLLVVPIGLAVTHQAGAMILFTTLLWFVHRLPQARTP
ncbi:MAG: COX15/CtaA family protein [Magnetococcales bacterium]|nr:COX15/CtaA family protein [Magnetococcales bacterium]